MVQFSRLRTAVQLADELLYPATPRFHPVYDLHRGGRFGACVLLVGAIGYLLVQRRALRESLEQFRLTANQAPVLIWTARPDTSLDYLNGYCEQLTGRPVEQLRENGWLDFVHPEDVDRCLATYMPAFEARRPLRLEYRLRHADGDYRWLLASGVPSTDGTAVFRATSAATSTSPNARMPKTGFARAGCPRGQHREIQQLAGRLIEAQDTERARIARDLHDDVSQQLAGLSIALSGLKQRMDEFNVGEELRPDLGPFTSGARSRAERPSPLSRFASHGAATWGWSGATSYCAELSGRTVRRRAAAQRGTSPSIAPEVALCLYRIAQEALRNVIAHAGARRADVRLLRPATMRRSRSRMMAKGSTSPLA